MSLPIFLRNTPIDTSGIERLTPPADHDAPSTGGVSFSDALSDAFKNANSLDKSSDELATRFADGDPNVGIHEVMIASEKSTIAVKYAVTLKNRALEAYKDLMNTPL